MSAYVVSNKTIQGMLQAVHLERHTGDRYYWNGEMKMMAGHLDKIGQKLIDENYRSVNYRYQTESKPHKYIHGKENIIRLSAVEIIKLCNGYRYQACETDDWEDTEAYEIWDTLREAAIDALPGYSDAAWAS